MPENISTDTGEGAKSRPESQERKQVPPCSQSQGDSGSDAASAHGVMSGLAALPGLSILSFSGPVETVSNLPGRTRFRTSAVVGREAARDLLIQNLSKIKGVTSIEVNLTSGSVLIHYQPETMTPELLFAAIIKLLDLEAEFLSTPESMLAREFREIGSSLNRTVYELTGGVTDFHTLLLISLAFLGIYIIRKDPVRAFPSGLTLLWWAYRSFRSDREGPD